MPKFLTNIDLQKNQLQNAVVHPLGSAPSNPVDGQIYYNTTNGDKTLYIFDAQLNAWKSIAGDITSVTSATTGQLTVTNADGPNPEFSVVTGAVVDGGTALATGDQIYDFVTSAIDAESNVITFSANTGSFDVGDDGEVNIAGGTGIESTATQAGGVTTITIDQANVTRTDTVSTQSATNGGDIDVVDSITSDAQGNVTAVNVKTVTLPTIPEGTVTSVDLTAGALIDVSGGPITSNGSIQVDVDLNELTLSTAKADVVEIPVIDALGAQKKVAVGTITLDQIGDADADINLDGNKLTNVTDPTDPQDAATKAYVDAALVGGLQYQGGYAAGSNSPDLESPSAGAIKQGFTYTVTSDGVFFTEQVRVGDTIIAEVDDPSTLADYTIVQANVDFASTSTVGIASFSSDNFAVSAAGEVTIKDNGVALGTETTGDYVQSITAGNGIAIDVTTGEGQTPTLDLDLNELTAATPVSADYVVGVDITDNSSKKFLVSDIQKTNEVSFDIVADGTTSTFSSTHSLGRGVIVQVYDNNSGSASYGETVFVDVTRTATGTSFTFGTAPASGQDYKAVIKAIG